HRGERQRHYQLVRARLRTKMGEAALQIAEKLNVTELKTDSRKNDNSAPPLEIHPWGEEGPPPQYKELRRHYYPRGGAPRRRVKIKKREVPKKKQWLTCYRVFRNGEPIGWQWGKPASYRSVAY